MKIIITAAVVVVVIIIIMNIYLTKIQLTAWHQLLEYCDAVRPIISLLHEYIIKIYLNPVFFFFFFFFLGADLGTKITPRFLSYTTIWAFSEIQFFFLEGGRGAGGLTPWLRWVTPMSKLLKKKKKKKKLPSPF